MFMQCTLSSWCLVEFGCAEIRVSFEKIVYLFFFLKLNETNEHNNKSTHYVGSLR